MAGLYPHLLGDIHRLQTQALQHSLCMQHVAWVLVQPVGWGLPAFCRLGTFPVHPTVSTHPLHLPVRFASTDQGHRNVNTPFSPTHTHNIAPQANNGRASALHHAAGGQRRLLRHHQWLRAKQGASNHMLWQHCLHQITRQPLPPGMGQPVALDLGGCTF